MCRNKITPCLIGLVLIMALTPCAFASDAFVGEIRMFAGNFAPRSFAFCDGQLMPISQNDALFSLLGTIYGGDGRTTFGLPDLRGRLAIHMGSGPGLTPRPIGQKGGQETVTLTEDQLPAHTHTAGATSLSGDQDTPGGHIWAMKPGDRDYSTAAPDVSMATTAISPTGGGQAHPNMQPFQTVNYIIALFGVYPSRS